ncbi:hypothetical protein FISHEDRAFT_45302 [Fistulina hepatica ATCC 64428]|uniref:NADH dehydrogenase [ubiquinone] 1 beta subcomplex subunit 7 n=1 Tax=Fistulina hepatica ATCC 64428 TaxID=1128425 RepID=A0A0D7A9J5_9AGAR|nr:hypothetical protein FISHEDRAFT_45302 [Fistulina hepatica ATCC 64428]
MSSSLQASREQLKAHGTPLAWRDHCSALLLPLNICRKETYYLPWKCEHERHMYEKCQYDDYVRRMKVLAKQKTATSEEDS